MFNTIHQVVERARELFANLANGEELQQQAALFGYDGARLSAGAALLTDVEQLMHAYQTAYGDQLAATERLRKAQETAQNLYAHHLAEARRAFRDNREANRTLALNETRKRGLRDWSGQATAFYTRLLDKPDYVEKMVAFNTKRGALLHGAELVQKVRTAKAEQDLQTSKTRTLRIQRAAAIKALRAWLTQFAALARAGLAQTPGQLQAFGLANPRRRKAMEDSAEAVAAPITVPMIHHE